LSDAKLKKLFVVRGQFTDDIGEDFLGLRELGIAAELGLSSLSIPKRLLKGKRNAKGPNATYGTRFFAIISFLLTPYRHSAKSAEPPPPYPPPQPFVSLTSETVKNQIGLLRGYFEHRLAGLDSLLDDPQNPAQAKLGPLGQVIRPSSAAIAAAAAGGSKKKTKPKDGAAGVVAGPATGAITAGTTVAGVSVGIMSGVVAGVMQPATPVLSSAGLLNPLGVSVAAPASAMVATTTPTGEPQPQAQTPKKKKATNGAGAGAAGGAGTGGGGGTGKKRGRPPEGLPPVVVASA
jgi:transcriptional activator SPT7